MTLMMTTFNDDLNDIKNQCYFIYKTNIMQN